MASGEKPTNDVSNVGTRTVLKWIALHLPLRWPPGVKTVQEVDQEVGGTKPLEFFADLAELEARVERFAAQRGGWSAHPIFGRMSEAEWLRWGYLHTDHHLRQFGV